MKRKKKLQALIKTNYPNVLIVNRNRLGSDSNFSLTNTNSP